METLFRILSHLPLRVLYGLSQGIIYPLLYYVVRYRRRVVRENLSMAFPEQSAKQRRATERQFYHWMCDLLSEIIYSYSISDEEFKERAIFTGLHEQEERILRQKGGMFMLGHIGCWEWGADIAHRFLSPDIHTSIVYLKLNNDSADQAMRTLREQRGCDVIEMHKLLRKMIEQKQSGRSETYIMIADQKPSRRSLQFWTPFFGMDTPFLTGTETLARKFDYPVFYIDISLPERGKYEAHVELLAEHPGELAEGELTALYARRLEENIRRQPHIWLWSHNRFKWNKLRAQGAL